MHLLTPPTIEPITVDQAKLAARSTGTEFDAMLPGMIASARQLAEQATGRLFLAQTWRVELADWPLPTDVLHIYQASGAAVSYWNGTTWASLSSGAFVAFPLDNGTGLAPALGTSWPALGDVAGGPRVRIDLTAGDAEAGNVPPCVATYMLALVSFWVENPSAVTAASLVEAPFLRSLLDPVKVWG